MQTHVKLTTPPRQSWQSLAHLRVLENAPAEPPPEPCSLDAPLGLHADRFVPSLPVGTPSACARRTVVDTRLVLLSLADATSSTPRLCSCTCTSNSMVLDCTARSAYSTPLRTTCNDLCHSRCRTPSPAWAAKSTRGSRAAARGWWFVPRFHPGGGDPAVVGVIRLPATATRVQEQVHWQSLVLMLRLLPLLLLLLLGAVPPAPVLRQQGK